MATIKLVIYPTDEQQLSTYKECIDQRWKYISSHTTIKTLHLLLVILTVEVCLENHDKMV